MERRRDKIAAWIALIIMTSAFCADFLSVRAEVALADLAHVGIHEDDAFPLPMTVMQEPWHADILLSEADDPDDHP